MRFVCELCGAAIDFPQVAQPSIHMESTSGGGSERVLTIGNREVHRCPARPDAKRR